VDNNCELSVIIPTYNEVENITLIVDAIRKVLDSIASYEIIIVDDNSKDKTWELAEQIAIKYINVSCFRRISAKGLSSAVVDGFMISHGKYLAVIDADLQHDETIIPTMLEHCRNGANLVVGSRYCKDGSTGKWSFFRKSVSRVATRFSQYVINNDLSDPMSGFFMIRKENFLGVVNKLNAKGYKILLEIMSQLDNKNLNILEVPYEFKNRVHGESKLSPEVAMQLIDFIYLKVFGEYIPIDYIKFISVGVIGSALHFTVLYIMHITLGYVYNASLLIAIEMTIIMNYFINNLWTFRQITHQGHAIIIGLIKFNILSGIGGVVSYYLSISLYESGMNWVLSSVVGAIVASLWNYNLNRIMTWQYNSKS
jgi:dolichol-phosphate mannosyltransferase